MDTNSTTPAPEETKPPKGRSFSFKRIIIIITVITAFILVAGGGYWIFSHQLAKQQQDITALSEENMALKTAPADTVPIPETIGGEKTVTVPPVETKHCASATIIAVVELREAVREAKPFLTQMAAVNALLKQDQAAAQALAILQPIAETGAPNPDILRKTFQDMKESLTLIAEQLPENPSFVERLQHSFSKVIKIRKIEHKTDANTDIMVVVADAEAALSTNNTAEAVRILKNVQDVANKQVISVWLADAELFLAAQTATHSLYAYVTSPSYTGDETSKGISQ